MWRLMAIPQMTFGKLVGVRPGFRLSWPGRQFADRAVMTRAPLICCSLPATKLLLGSDVTGRIEWARPWGTSDFVDVDRSRPHRPMKACAFRCRECLALSREVVSPASDRVMFLCMCAFGIRPPWDPISARQMLCSGPGPSSEAENLCTLSTSRQYWSVTDTHDFCAIAADAV